MIHQGHKYKLGAQSVIALESADKGHVKVAEIVLPWLGQSSWCEWIHSSRRNEVFQMTGVRMSECEACTKAESNPASGLYHAGCDGCKRRAMRSAPSYFNHMEQLKRRRDRFDRRMYLDGVEISEGLRWPNSFKRFRRVV